MTKPAATVYVVDDDPAMREALDSLIRSRGLRALLYGSAQEFLRAPEVDAPSCLVLDVGLPGLSGLDLQSLLGENRRILPIVFITAGRDVPPAVRAMKAGAVEFLTKPFLDRVLVEAIERAIERSRTERRDEAERRELRARLDSLSPREREVMDLVVAGLANKQIAAQLQITEATVKAHRGRVMHGMRADSIADLVRMAEKLKPRSG